MKRSLIVYESGHHDNTQKVVESIAQKYKARMERVSDADKIKDLEQYEVFLFASGIYHGKPGPNLISFIKKNAKKIYNKKVLLLLTSGTNNKKYMHEFKKELEKYDINVDEDYQCLGYDTFGPWKFMGGIAKNHPNIDEMQTACNVFREWLE